MNDEVSELLKKAEQGDADAELRLGSAYCSGDGVEKSSSEAEKWWLRAAALGSAGAARCRNRFTRHLIRAVKAGHRMRTAAQTCSHSFRSLR